MSASTFLETHRARTAHRCTWCATRIKPGETYNRWRWFDGGDAGTQKMHPECYQAMQEAAAQEDGYIEYYPGENPRGCNCGHMKDCEKCAARCAIVKGEQP